MPLEKLFEVYEFAKEAHKNKKKKSGKDYITHPIAVAEIARYHKADDETIYGCLLHDVVEDTPYTLQDLNEKFGGRIAFLVDGVTKLEGKDAFTKTIEKIKIFSKIDKRVIFVKMADRLHNLKRAIDPKDKNKILIGMEKYNISTKEYIQIGRDKGYRRLATELENELNLLNKKLK
jgi:(p)ppGpp synthase/HD superfamily hydrolase